MGLFSVLCIAGAVLTGIGNIGNAVNKGREKQGKPKIGEPKKNKK